MEDAIKQKLEELRMQQTRLEQTINRLQQKLAETQVEYTRNEGAIRTLCEVTGEKVQAVRPVVTGSRGG
jgi:uncharacterized coiled-coil protein SlyX